MKLLKLDKEFFESEQTAGILLMCCTVASLLLTNFLGISYSGVWHTPFFHQSVEFWVNDGLMTIFFLLVGLEIKREMYAGELSDIRKSLLPLLAAAGGMVVPAAIYLAFNAGTSSSKGFGIPMATDIAFSLAVLSLLGKRVPPSLKIFLTALAIADDLGAIVIIALFYSSDFSVAHFGLAIVVLVAMLVLNRMNFRHLWAYLALGAALWYFMHRSGIHPTIAGVLIAFAIPFSKKEQNSLSHKLQHHLHKPVSFFILPLFALANTAITISPTFLADLATPTSYGIIFGLLLGKPLGIFLFAMTGVAIGICALPAGMSRSQLFWCGVLAGIGFTMSIFITLLAFDDLQLLNASKIAIMVGSLLSGVVGFVGLRLVLGRSAS
ncbi:MAG: Na+/H+ antiporter NhaA [Bacteroidetes bacterium]|nr:Na+/H+ antiporter NhaA [Bacteroidota bacterium]MBS1541106.1 Na+/H+ antiporter NhaA [Bacteroidota bacterium]